MLSTFSQLTYYGIGGTVAEVEAPESFAALQNLWRRHLEAGTKVALLGAGSNVLCSDEPFDGHVVTCRALQSWQVLSAPGAPVVQVLVEAGVTNTECAEIGYELGFLDLAWMFRMPGQLGATVRMNARCYGGEISGVTPFVFTIGAQGRPHMHLGQDAFLGYKDTIFMRNKEVVVAAVLELRHPADRSKILQAMEACERDRHRKKHFLFPSCGSTFKNNYAIGKPSGQIFDELGFKGQRSGNAQVSEHHGNFLFNLGQARASDVLSLAARMSSAAAAQGMDLELEVQPVGVFDEALARELKFGTLDPETAPLGPQKVLTGLANYGTAHDRNTTMTEPLPCVLARVPFGGWDEGHGRGLGLVTLEIVQLRSLSLSSSGEGGASDLPLVRVSFCCKNREHLEALLDVQPEHPGFQDRLWETSVFECFLFGPEGSSQYLELEVHDDRTWLAIPLAQYRQRAEADLREPTGIRPFCASPSSGGPASMGFEITAAALSPYLKDGRLRIKGAYAGWRKSEGDTGLQGQRERSYAVAPPRPKDPLGAEQAPDFHGRSGFLEIALQP